VWYTLPTLLAVGFLTLLYTFGNDSTDWGAFRRMALAGVFTLALSAAVFVPLWTQQGYIGRHPNERGAGVVVDFWNMTRQYFDGDPARYAQRTAPGQVEFYHAFVIPLWFAALTVWLALTLRPLRKLNDSDPAPDAARWIIPVGLVMLVIATVWAAGGNPFFVWLYQTVPLLGQWRFVGRALAVGGFWLAVLVALYYDEAWRTATSRTWATLHPQLASVRWNMAAALLVAGAAAAYPVVAQWEPYSGTERISTFEPTCLDWLRARYPDEPLTVYVVGYDVVTPYLERRIRLHEIEADYRAEPVSATLGAFDLRTALPAFGMARTQQDRDRLAALGYTVITDSPAVDGTNPCLYALNTPTLPYTFTTTLTAIQATPANDLLIAEQTQEAALIERRFDRVRVQATGTPDAVLIVQETAYPGWHVSVDGQPARLEAVGSMVGVQLPDDGQPHEVVFEYRPALLHISLWITLLAALALALYLAGADRAAPPIRALVQRRRGAVAE
jgi:hypothetical protein